MQRRNALLSMTAFAGTFVTGAASAEEQKVVAKGVTEPQVADPQAEKKSASSRRIEIPGRPSSKYRRGLYINSGTLIDNEKLDGFIRLSKAFNVDTFIVDLWSSGPRYRECVRKIQGEGIRYVPRVVVFPEGGTTERVRSPAYWAKRYRTVEQGIKLGAKRIQLDYIRYNTDREPDPMHAHHVLEVVHYFSKRLHNAGVALEIDVFGEVATSASPRIGQDLKLLAPQIDGVCPMVYPSHYWPYSSTWKKPFRIVHNSISSGRAKMGPHRRIDAYLEMFNFRFRMPNEQRAHYIRRQVQGAMKGGADGWYAWSATNSYGMLFDLLAAYGNDFEQMTNDAEDPIKPW